MFDPEEPPRPPRSLAQPSMAAATLSLGIVMLPLLLLAASLLGGGALWTYVMPWSSSVLRLAATVGIAAVMIGLAVLERRNAD